MDAGAGIKNLLLERHAIQSAAEINSVLFSSRACSVTLLSSPYRRGGKTEELDFYIYIVK